MRERIKGEERVIREEREREKDVRERVKRVLSCIGVQLVGRERRGGRRELAVGEGAGRRGGKGGRDRESGRERREGEGFSSFVVVRAAKKKKRKGK